MDKELLTAIEQLNSAIARPVELVGQANEQFRLVLETQAEVNNRFVKQMGRLEPNQSERAG